MKKIFTLTVLGFTMAPGSFAAVTTQTRPQIIHKTQPTIDKTMDKEQLANPDLSMDNKLPPAPQPEAKKKAGEVIPMVKEALARLQNLQKLVWISKFRIETLQNQKDQSILKNHAAIILESIQRDMTKAKLNSPELRQSPDALVYGWQQEGYANALNVTFELDINTCKKVMEQSIKRFKARASIIKGLMWRGKKPAQQLLSKMEQHCKLANNRETLLKNSNQTVENAIEFNETYQQFNTLLQQK